MTVPLLILTAFALLAGLVFGPTGWFATYLERTPGMPPATPHEINWSVTLDGTIAALVGFGIAAVMYVVAQTLPERLGRASGPLHPLSYNRFYVDELLSWIVLTPLKGLAWLADALDRHVIDRLARFVGWSPTLIAYALRPFQGGRIPSYAFWMACGLMAFVITLSIVG